MTPQAELRMRVYREGQRAYNSQAACPYTDWRAGTWAKGWVAAEKYHAELVGEAAPRYQPTPLEQWQEVCERSAAYVDGSGGKGLMIDQTDLVLIGTLLGA